MQTAKGDGMQLMDQHILDMLNAKLINGDSLSLLH
jgi:Tfp pilus assembly ATPase PilU